MHLCLVHSLHELLQSFPDVCFRNAEIQICLRLRYFFVRFFLLALRCILFYCGAHLFQLSVLDETFYVRGGEVFGALSDFFEEAFVITAVFELRSEIELPQVDGKELQSLSFVWEAAVYGFVNSTRSQKGDVYLIWP